MSNELEQLVFVKDNWISWHRTTYLLRSIFANCCAVNEFQLSRLLLFKLSRCKLTTIEVLQNPQDAGWRNYNRFDKL